MNIEGRILQSLRPRRDGLMLRSEIRTLGSPSQVSVALKALSAKGLVERLGRGVYAKPEKVAQLGKPALLTQALLKTNRVRAVALRRKAPHRMTPTARHVQQLAKREGVKFSETFSDRWADAVTRLAGDVVKSDATDDLLVALTRAGKLSPRDMVKLVMAHHRDLKLV